MGTSRLKNWRTVFLLSIIVPVSLLAYLKLMGIIDGTNDEAIKIVESKTLEPVTWELERPKYATTGINENHTYDSITKTFYGGDFLANSTLTIYQFGWLWFSSPCLSMNVSATASVSRGYIACVNVSFQEDYTPSQVAFYLNDWSFNFNRLSLVNYTDCLVGVQKAFFSMKGINNPTQASFWRLAEWVLRSPINQSHLLIINIEFTYFNGTAYKKVAQPFILKVFQDNNNSFETAEELKVGQIRRAYIQVEIDYDNLDYYKIWLQEGIRANFTLRNFDRCGIDMYIYNPHRILEACIFEPVNSTLQQIILNINETGWWYIKISVQSSHFIYAIFITTQPQVVTNEPT